MTKQIKAGDHVRLTSAFLRSTGQHTGDEPRRTWTVLSVSSNGRMAVVDQLLSDESRWFTADELAADPSLKWRRINVANLQALAARKAV